MEVWKKGSEKCNYAETRMNKGFQPTVNEMCFVKKILPYFHISMLHTSV
jgi:hypothetical protein